MRRPRVRIVLPQRWHVAWQHRSGNKAVKLLMTGILIVIVFSLSVFWIDNHLRPIITQMAKVRVDYLASKAINEAIFETIERENVSYEDMVIFEKDIYGQITALKTNMLMVNRFKADVTNEILDAVEGIGTSDLGIPIGNIINGDLFSGRGPLIPIRILPLGTASASFQNVFSSAGINQTRHEIMMEVAVNISVLMPGYSTATLVTVQVAVAETVIVGAVPDTYTNFEDGGKIFSEKAPYSALVPD